MTTTHTPAGPIFIRWSDDGQHIREWRTSAFDGATGYAALAASQSARDGGVASTWASPTLGRAHEAINVLRGQLAQPSESGIDEALRAALDAIEHADTELAAVAF